MNKLRIVLVTLLALLLVGDIVAVKSHWNEIQTILQYQSTQAIIKHLQTEVNAPISTTVDGGTTSDYVDDGGGWE